MALTRVKLTRKIPPSWDSGLTPEQLKVVQDVGGVRFVAACPGGGKTKTLVQSIVYLIEVVKVPAREILAFTFTNQAAEEMRDRLEVALGPVRAGQLDCCTMHSFFYKILRNNAQAYPGWNYTEMSLIDKARGGKKKLYRQIAKELNLSEGDFDFGEVRRKIGRWKNQNVDPKEAMETCEASESLIARFYQRYEEIKWKDKLIDFEDMLIFPLRLFDKFPEIAEIYSEMYRHIFLDEYHDTSPVQNELVQRMNQVHGNLFLVCDPNQSIYGFRGADPDVVLQYQTHFPGARMLTLTQNFRSRQEIVERSYRLIGHNDDSEALGLTAFSEKPGGTVQLLGVYDTEEKEADAITQVIQRSIANRGPVDGKWGNFTILFRMNAQSRAPEEALTRAQIPYRIIGASSFYKRREIQDLLAYLDFVNHPEPLGEAFERIYNKPNRWLGKAWYKQFLAEAGTGRDLSHLLSTNYSASYMNRGARSLLGQLRTCQTNHSRFAQGEIDLSELANRILTTVRYIEWLAGEDDNRTDRVDNLREFIHTLGKFTSIDALFKYIELVTAKLTEESKEEDRVLLMTVHKAKGTENRTVFVIGMNQGVLPHALAGTQEERRVCFVAVSRAEEECYLSSTKRFRGKDCEPSIFLEELGLEVPSELPE